MDYDNDQAQKAQFSVKPVNVNVDINKRSVTELVGIEVVSGLSIDYETYLIKHMPRLREFLKEQGVVETEYDYTLARIGLWLNKSASNKKYGAKMAFPSGKVDITLFSDKLSISRAMKDTAEDKLTINRLRRCLMPYVAKFLQEMNTKSAETKAAASRFRVLDNVPIEFSFPESYLVVPMEERDKFLKAVLSYEASWNDPSVKGRWSYKAIQFFKDKNPLKVYQGPVFD